jgi:hypothetical protein
MPAARDVFPSEAIELFLRFGEVREICLDRDQGMARRRRSREELKEVDALVERNRLVKHRLTVLMVDPAIARAIFR